MSIEYHADLKEVQSDERLCALLSADGQSAPFDRLEWLQGLVEHCGISPLVAVACEGQALAVLPLQVVRGQFTGLANWYTFRFHPLFTPGADRLALLTGMARDLGRRCRRITLTGVPDEDGSAGLIERAFNAAGWVVRREATDCNHVLAVRGRSYEEYLAGRPGQLRTTLKRKSGKVETRILTRFDAAAWAHYEAIYARSWKPEEGSPAFLRAFAEAEGAAGRLRLGLAHVVGEHAGGEQASDGPVAAQMWTVEGGAAFIHKLAHTEESKPFSPGSVLSAALFRHVIDTDKVATIDFGTGDDPYKRDWMEEVRPRYRIDLLRPADPRNWLVFARHGFSRLAGR